MKYSPYGLEAFPAPSLAGKRGRVDPKRVVPRLGNGPERPETLRLPQGMTDQEASFFLGVFARLKERRFGRVKLVVQEGNVTSVEFAEKIDRALFRSVSS